MKEMNNNLDLKDEYISKIEIKIDKIDKVEFVDFVNFYFIYYVR